MKITNSHSVHPTKAEDRSAKALEWVFANPRVPKSEVVTSAGSASIFLCKYCGNSCNKSGIEPTTQKQRYRCTCCKKSQQRIYNSVGCELGLDKSIVALTKEGVGIRGTARLLNISPTTLIDRIKKIASNITPPPLTKGKTYEVDELRTYVKKKAD